MAAKRSAVYSARVAPVPGRKEATTSARGRTLSSSSVRQSSSTQGGQPPGRRLTPMVCAPRALHSLAKLCPMSPMPTMSTVQSEREQTEPKSVQACARWASR